MPRTDWPTALVGYVKKDSPTGNQIFDILNDGKQHETEVKVKGARTQGYVVDILEVVSETWLIE